MKAKQTKTMSLAIMILAAMSYLTGNAQRYSESDFYSKEGQIFEFVVDGIWFEENGHWFVGEETEGVMPGMARTISPHASWHNNWSGGYYKGVLEIPEEVTNDDPGIFKGTFKVGVITDLYRNWVTCIKIPDTVIAIYSITQCDYLEDVVFGKNVEFIRGVNDCPSLRLCDIPQSARHINYGFNKLPLIETMRVSEALEDTCRSSFNDNIGLRTVTLPSRPVTFDNCFNGCAKIESITILCPEPYEYPQNCFMDVDKSKCILYVPEESIETYSSTDGWNQLATIFPLVDSNADFPYAENEKFFTSKLTPSGVTVNNTSKFEVSVLDLSGRLLGNARPNAEISIALAPGVYVITNGYHTIKTFIK